MRKLLPILLAVIGIAIGGGAGYFLRPTPENTNNACASEPCQETDGADAHIDKAGADAAAESGGTATNTPTEFAKLNNQFIVPDIQNGVIKSLVVLSLSIEITQGSTEKVFTMEPKLRDAFLQVLFDHANAGGFRGDFTSSAKMEDLRRALLEAARKVLTQDARSILISDIVRQDMV